MSGKRHLTKAQREARLHEIGKMYIRGGTPREIALKIGVNHMTVRREIEILYARWREETDVDAKAKLLREAEEVRKEAWAAWERSKEDAETSTQKVKKSEVGGEGMPVEATLRSEGQVGDSRYLNHVEWASEREAKIRGTDAPTRNEHSGPGGGPIEHRMTRDERRSRIAELIGGRGDRTPESPGAGTPG